MSLPADSYGGGRVSLHFTQSGLSMPATAGVVVEKGSEYILAHTVPRELDRHPLQETVSLVNQAKNKHFQIFEV
jgi:hypothetical protein